MVLMKSGDAIFELNMFIWILSILIVISGMRFRIVSSTDCSVDLSDSRCPKDDEITFVGCFRKSCIEAKFNHTSSHMSMNYCFQMCRDREYRVAGLFDGNVCLCGCSDPCQDGRFNAGDQCGVPCPGDVSTFCGGRDGVQTYTILDQNKMNTSGCGTSDEEQTSDFPTQDTYTSSTSNDTNRSLSQLTTVVLFSSDEPTSIAETKVDSTLTIVIIASVSSVVCVAIVSIIVVVLFRRWKTITERRFTSMMGTGTRKDQDPFKSEYGKDNAMAEVQIPMSYQELNALPGISSPKSLSGRYVKGILNPRGPTKDSDEYHQYNYPGPEELPPPVPANPPGKPGAKLYHSYHSTEAPAYTVQIPTRDAEGYLLPGKKSEKGSDENKVCYYALSPFVHPSLQQSGDEDRVPEKTEFDDPPLCSQTGETPSDLSDPCDKGNILRTISEHEYQTNIN